MAQILCGLSYKVRSTFITKFGTNKLFIVISDMLPRLASLMTWPFVKSNCVIHIKKQNGVF